MGENRIAVILKGDADSAMQEVNNSVGALLTVTCIPLRHYENFTKSLGGDETLCNIAEPNFTNVKKLFLVNVTVEYPGAFFIYLFLKNKQQYISIQQYKKIKNSKTECCK